MHGISSLLFNWLRWEGPPGWRQFLLEQRDQSIARHREITRLLDAIDLPARSAGIALVALKGAALDMSGTYSAGERPMGDIDLLVRPDDLNAISRMLSLCDYEAAYSTHRHDVFQPFNEKIIPVRRLGEHLDNPIKIEVHTRIAERLPVNAVDITRFLFPQRGIYELVHFDSLSCMLFRFLQRAFLPMIGGTWSLCVQTAAHFGGRAHRCC